jgi:hypothetical protein
MCPQYGRKMILSISNPLNFFHLVHFESSAFNALSSLKLFDNHTLQNALNERTGEDLK